MSARHITMFDRAQAVPLHESTAGWQTAHGSPALTGEYTPADRQVVARNLAWMTRDLPLDKRREVLAMVGAL